MSNVAMLNLMVLQDDNEKRIKGYYWEYIYLKNTSNKKALEEIRFRIDMARRNIKHASNNCSHPFEVTLKKTTYCPICNEIISRHLENGIVVSSYEELISLKRKLQDLLSLKPELSIEEILAYLKKETKSETEDFAR